jgi:hypothetical protein
MLQSPIDDFKNRTLKAFSTLLEKLAYVSSLLGLDGIYHHWGITNSYGPEKANAALGQIHAEFAKETVRTTIRELYSQWKRSQGPPPELKAPPSGDALLSAHLRLNQESVKTVAEQERSSHPDASPPPPPGQ